MEELGAEAILSLLDFKHLVQESALEASSYQAAHMVSGERVADQGKDMTSNSGNDVKIFGKFRMQQRLQNLDREVQKHVAFKHGNTRLVLGLKEGVFPFLLLLPLGRALV